MVLGLDEQPSRPSDEIGAASAYPGPLHESGFARAIGASGARPIMVLSQVLLFVVFSAAQVPMCTCVTLVPCRPSSAAVVLGGSCGLDPYQSHVLKRPCGSVSALPARVTLSLGVTPSGREGVGAYASFVSRIGQVHAERIGVQTWPI